MDINLLVLNSGNSRLGVGVFAAGELRQSLRLDNTRPETWAAALAGAWDYIRAVAAPAVAACSVHPAQEAALAEAVRQATGQRIGWVGREIDIPIEVRTERPAATGIDRILNIAAAYEQMEKSCVVVDAGTAVTVDVCNDAGEFLGGAIAPGARMMLQALHHGTARLPQIELAVPDQAIGQNTEQAMRHGVYHGIRGMVRELVENYATQLGAWPEIIATGGDAPLLFEGWELVHAISPDLTLYGIALAYAEHHIRHGT